jgi:hypothetical protein
VAAPLWLPYGAGPFFHRYLHTLDKLTPTYAEMNESVRPSARSSPRKRFSRAPAPSRPPLTDARFSPRVVLWITVTVYAFSLRMVATL